MKHKKVSKKSVNSTTDNPHYNNYDQLSVSSTDSKQSSNQRESRLKTGNFDSMSTRSGMSSRSSSVFSQRSSIDGDNDIEVNDLEGNVADASKGMSEIVPDSTGAFNTFSAQKVSQLLNEYRLSCEINQGAASNDNMNALNNLILKNSTAFSEQENFSQILFNQLANTGK